MAGIPGLENITASFSGSSGTMWLIAKMLFYGVIVGVGGYLAWYFLSFNIKVRIHQRGNEGFVTTWKKGKFIKDKQNPGVFLFKIMSDDRWAAPLDRNYVQVEKKSMGRMARMVEFAEDEQGRLQPVRPLLKSDLVAWSGWGNNAMEFTTRTAKEAIEKFKKGDFWSKYGNLVYMGLFLLVFIMALVLFRQMSEISDALGATAGTFKEAAVLFNQALPRTATNTSMVIVG